MLFLAPKNLNFITERSIFSVLLELEWDEFLVLVFILVFLLLIFGPIGIFVWLLLGLPLERGLASYTYGDLVLLRLVVVVLRWYMTYFREVRSKNLVLVDWWLSLNEFRGF